MFFPEVSSVLLLDRSGNDMLCSMLFLSLGFDVLTDHFNWCASCRQKAETLTPECFFPKFFPDFRILFFQQPAAGTFICIDKFTEFRFRLCTKHYMHMVNIMIPSKDFRFFRFGKDSHGFERDDIQAYWTSIKALVRTDQDKDGNAKKNGKRYIYLNKNTEDPVYKICFEPQKNENGAFVEPEPVYLNAKQLSQIYNEQYLIGKERRKERDPNKMLEENKEQKKENRKQSVGKER